MCEPGGNAAHHSFYRAPNISSLPLTTEVWGCFSVNLVAALESTDILTIVAASICRFKLSLYHFIFQQRLGSQMWGLKICEVRKAEKQPAEIAFWPTCPKNQKEAPNSSNAISFLFIFSIQIPGFSMANSCQVVADSAHPLSCSWITISKYHRAIRYHTTIKNISLYDQEEHTTLT